MSACADKGASTASPPPTTAGQPVAGGPTSAPPTTEAPVSNEWALAYTGGAAGAADPSLEPITIGYINQEGGVPAFPEATAGIDAAVAYVNSELGGIGGHPLELAKCVVQTEEDGQRCATEMANNEAVDVVMTGTLVVGNKAIYDVLSGQKPIVIGFPGTIDDFVANDAFAFTPGAPGVVQGMGIFVGTKLAGVTKVAIVHSDNPAGQAGAETILKPALAASGITDVTLVPVADTATGPDLAAAIQAAGVDSADVFMPLLTVQGCIATYDALQSLGLSPTVVTTGLCYGTPMTDHLADLGLDDPVPDGWYYGDTGYSYFLPDEDSGMSTYIAEIAEYGQTGVEYTGFAGALFANLLTVVKFANEIGVDNLSPDAYRQAAEGFAGPMMMIAGPMDCGWSPFATLCGSQMGVQQYKDGEWIPVASALNGAAIDTRPVG
jgi:branched-chain amino acid transport system substrate-binding protein